MSEKVPNTLLELLSAYKVEVPIIQRDYAQGRYDDHTKMVRQNLLEDMKSAILKKTLPLDLNFVYGKTENGKFLPIDGQQRLTTLFFLHIYAFCDDNEKTKLLHKFTYETRKSSRDFLERVVDNRSSIFISKLIPSKEIEDSEWFVLSWKHDPTIQSALTMLDDIKKVFADVKDLPQILSGQGFSPIVFQFLEIKDLGIEDSLYIKLNARGKPLTPFENFKARLIGRLQKLNLQFADEFGKRFDGKWTDLFWSNNAENFDISYLTFFGVLFMNNGLISNDTNWANEFDFDKIDTENFETIFHTLNFLCENKNSKALKLVFNALSEKRTYSDRILFHAIAIYMYAAKGTDNGSLTQWIRIIQNLTLNSQIDTSALYRRSIEGVNKLSKKRDNLLEHFSSRSDVIGFSQEQIKEEQNKAYIILLDNEFAKMIYKAEEHPYFSGQIRSALYYAMDSIGKYDMKEFVQYWNKIFMLFDETKPKHGNLLRQALFIFGDYTLPVGSYRTLCIDDPNEASSTPSLKRLFSNHGTIVKQLLDALNINVDIEQQLKEIVKNSTVPQNDWRYCFIKFPNLFAQMSISHLRLRDVNSEWLIIPNKTSNGYNNEIFITTLNIALKQQGINPLLDGYLGMLADRWLRAKSLYVRFKNGHFIVKDMTDTHIVFQSISGNPITETLDYIRNM